MAAAGMKVSVKPEASEVEVEDQDIPLFVRTFEEAEKIIKRYELREVARFASWKSDNAFAKDNGKARSWPTSGQPISVHLRYCEIELGYSIFPCDVIIKKISTEIIN